MGLTALYILMMALVSPFFARIGIVCLLAPIQIQILNGHSKFKKDLLEELFRSRSYFYLLVHGVVAILPLILMDILNLWIDSIFVLRGFYACVYAVWLVMAAPLLFDFATERRGRSLLSIDVIIIFIASFAGELSLYLVFIDDYLAFLHLFIYVSTQCINAMVIRYRNEADVISRA